MVGSGGHRGEATRQIAPLVTVGTTTSSGPGHAALARYLPPRGLPTVSTVRKEGELSIPTAGVILRGGGRSGRWRGVRSDATLGTAVVPEYSFVIPVCNERETLGELHRRLRR